MVTCEVCNKKFNYPTEKDGHSSAEKVLELHLIRHALETIAINTKKPLRYGPG